MKASGMKLDQDPTLLALLESVDDGVYIVDRHRRIQYWNAGAERITGYSAEDALGRRCSESLLEHVDASGYQLCFGRCPLEATMADCQSRQACVYLRHREGHRVATRVRAIPLMEHGECVGAVEVFSDGVGTTQSVRRLFDLVDRDPLTHLFNRRWLDRRVEQALADCASHGLPCGLLLADIDRFKTFNDLYGHQTGDRVLCAVGRTLESVFTEPLFVGRWGGEEFVMGAPGLGGADLAGLAEQARTLVQAMVVQGPAGPLAVTVSVGYGQARAGEDADTLLARVDAAMYAAKAGGRNRVAQAE